jgi:hypothetical protein
MRLDHLHLLVGGGYRSMDVWKGERCLSLEIVRGRDKTAFIPSIPQTAKRWSTEEFCETLRSES